MEQQSISKKKLFKFIPKAVSAFTFKTHVAGGFSRPFMSIILADGRRRVKNSSFEAREEPTSPKISCMGQIKNKNKNKKEEMERKNHVLVPKLKPNSSKGLFGWQPQKPAARKSDFSGEEKPPLLDRAASLSQMRRFASGRDAFAGFTALIDCDSIGEREQEETIIPLSAALMVVGCGSMVPRKEINLWKRRTMCQPKPLQLNTI